MVLQDKSCVEVYHQTALYLLGETSFTITPPAIAASSKFNGLSVHFFKLIF